ncbi:MAG: DUF1636 family protein [Gammaproteobacteria bacterium]
MTPARGEATPPALLFVCTTCVRDAARVTESQGARLARALRERLAMTGEGLVIREVACLNGCRSPCNVGLRGARRWTYRFSRCTLADVDALLATARRYWASAQGELAAAELPDALRARLSARTPPPI